MQNRPYLIVAGADQSIDLRALIGECIQEAARPGGLAATTRKGYRWHLCVFADWLKREGHAGPGPDAIAAYMDHVQRPKCDGGRGFGPASTRTAWVAISYLTTWMIGKRILAGSVMPDYQLPRLALAARPVMGRESKELLRAAVEKIEDEYRRTMARAIFAVLNGSAIRNNELRDLEVSHYDAGDKSLWIMCGKGGKRRQVPLTRSAIAALNDWLAIRPADAPHSFLFCWDDAPRRRLGGSGLIRILREISDLAGFVGNQKTHKPHAMRRGWATRAMQSTKISIDDIRQVLGHASILTTQIYVRPDFEELKAKINFEEEDEPPAATAAAAPSPRPAVEHDPQLREPAPIRHRLPPARRGRPE